MPAGKLFLVCRHEVPHAVGRGLRVRARRKIHDEVARVLAIPRLEAAIILGPQNHRCQSIADAPAGRYRGPPEHDVVKLAGGDEPPLCVYGILEIGALGEAAGEAPDGFCRF